MIWEKRLYWIRLGSVLHNDEKRAFLIVLMKFISSITRIK